VADSLIVRGAPRAQPQGHLARPPRGRHDRLHRPVGLGQVLARVRHDLRRGAAPVRRVAVAYARPVPRPDGQARRRLHRGPVARVSIDQKSTNRNPRSTGRHDHRGLRLPAPAVGARRPPHCPGLRRADHPADPAADRRPAARAARGHPVPGARAGGPRPQGRVRDLFRELQSRASRAPGSTARPSRCRKPPQLEKKLKHTIEVVVDRLSAKPRASDGSPTVSRPRSSWPGEC
jgi:hypothetical protein